MDGDTERQFREACSELQAQETALEEQQTLVSCGLSLHFTLFSTAHITSNKGDPLRGRAARTRDTASKTDLKILSLGVHPITRLQLLGLRHRR